MKIQSPHSYCLKGTNKTTKINNNPIVKKKGYATMEGHNMRNETYLIFFRESHRNTMWYRKYEIGYRTRIGTGTSTDNSYQTTQAKYQQVQQLKHQILLPEVK